MDNKPALANILFLDIETVPQTASLEQLTPEMQTLWEEKFTLIKARMPEKYAEETTADEGYQNGAGIYAEFAKIVCISVGIIYVKGSEKHIRTKSFTGDDEGKLLRDFAQMTSKFLDSNQHFVCGHNIKEFDIPFICRRMLVNGITIPESLNVSGKKPWETSFIDTLELWKFGDFKNYTSLKLLTAILGIPTSKDDIDGSQVASVYYNDKDINRISHYCEKDVVATAQVYLRLCGEQPILLEHIERAD
ncbi:MAG TPA: 3'-5' exonuclease [Paludibacteraceae bacterium]|nr:3'-5' exonuclease [Paludibacteraceae bacterium]HQB69196.1 3'-5' exonuclease [Paludibacteraceae bacterium]HRS68006.1 3'-5' exonuclease [Paludibacteraceae bacterium]